ncbi:MAG: M18 family aminopeptidase [Myxococcales bacterium]|nr:M18 family aminopeptidase [Myxococcales bacterium]
MNAALDLVDFLNASPSPFHCVAAAAARLTAAGFVEVKDDDAAITATPGKGAFMKRAGTLFAWLPGSESPSEAGFRLIGAHTDSPNLRLKPKANQSKEGYATWAVEPYGGVLLHTWTDRDLGLAGRVAVRDATATVPRIELVRLDAPLARVANLAIHLDREVTTRGLILNKQTHLPPMIGLAGAPSVERLVAEAIGCAESDVVGFDLGLYDTQPATLGGVSGEFVLGARLDNQASCHSALSALIEASRLPAPAAHTAVICLFDHEECGSGSERGAESVLLSHVLDQLTDGHPATGAGGLRRALSRSFCVSADMAHGVHPNYADKHEPSHKPMLNGGPVIKTNMNMSYATDAETGARFRMACRDEGVPFQEFVVRSDIACGSTIGAIVAAGLAVRTVDVGCAMLSMHSIREQAGAADVAYMTAVMRRILVHG